MAAQWSPAATTTAARLWRGRIRRSGVSPGSPRARSGAARRAGYDGSKAVVSFFLERQGGAGGEAMAPAVLRLSTPPRFAA